MGEVLLKPVLGGVACVLYIILVIFNKIESAIFVSFRIFFASEGSNYSEPEPFHISMHLHCSSFTFYVGFPTDSIRHSY